MEPSGPDAGWYADPESPGLIRYWDGQRWTSHRMDASAARPLNATRGNWFARHKLLTAGLVLGMIVAFGSASEDDGVDPDPAGASAQVEDTEDDPAESQKAGSTKKSRAKQSTDKQSVAREPGNREPEPRESVAEQQGTQRTFLVTRVIDGDTLELSNGETVRLVGIDTPEVGECGYDRATKNLVDLALDKRVQLTRSDEDRDHYGRLLRYVDVGSKDAGLRLIQNGNAIARYDSRDGYGFHPREDRYVRADRQAKDFFCPKPAPDPQPRPLAGGGGGCAPGYRPCIPPYPPDLDCADVDGPIYVSGSDPHGLDADGDGVACE